MKSRTSQLFLGLVAACLATSSLAAQKAEYEGAEFQLRRLAWFDEQRAYPNAEVNWDAMMRARRSVTERTGFMGIPSIASAVIGQYASSLRVGNAHCDYGRVGSRISRGNPDQRRPVRGGLCPS